MSVHDDYRAGDYGRREQRLGSFRDHERRCSGRKVAYPGTVVLGAVRMVVAASASRLRLIEATALVLSDVSAWRDLRTSLERRQEVLLSRFRLDLYDMS
jgi:hypothetical protein